MWERIKRAFGWSSDDVSGPVEGALTPPSDDTPQPASPPVAAPDPVAPDPVESEPAVSEPAVSEPAATERAAAEQMAEEPIEVPPFTPIPETSAAPSKAELRRALDRDIARGAAATAEWEVRLAARAAEVTDAHLDELIAVLDGGDGAVPEVVGMFGAWWLAEKAPSLSMIHLLRLSSGGSRLGNRLTVEQRADAATDPRIIEDALARAGAAAGIDMLPRVWVQTEPEAAWPWAAQNLDVVCERLGEARWTIQTLRIIEHFPTLPPRLRQLVAALAVGNIKNTRALARRVLGKHPGARQLAEQALDDSRSEIRAEAASWLGSMADPSAVPALRAALAKEKREVVRAGLLSALEASGDDISAELSASKLLAEAVKGLKAKPPASLSWFDSGLLPSVRWTDGTPVDGRIVRWWVVLADKLKNPSGQGLIDRYLGLLEPGDAAVLGTTVLRVWVERDTQHPLDAESRALAATKGPVRYQHAQDRYAGLQAKPGLSGQLELAEAGAALSLEEHIAHVYAEHQAVYLSSASANKGLLALTTRMPGSELAITAQSYQRDNPRRRSQIEALVYALSANGQPAALQLLLSVARRHKMAGVQATARGLVDDVAAARGWTGDELADRTIPSAGFGDDRLLHLDFGSREFLGRLTPAGAIELSTSDGKAIKALPAPLQGDDEEAVKEAKKQLTASRKEAKSVLTQQSARLYEAMCTGRRWSVADWSEFLAGHPLVSQLVTRLVWLGNPDEPGQRTFRPTEDGTFIDVDDEPIELAPESSVGLAHATLLSTTAVTSWRSHLADYGVKPLFDQLSATVPPFSAGATALDDLAGHMTDTFSFRGMAVKRGYARAVSEGESWFTAYTKTFASTGLTAVIGFTGSYLPEERMPCATESLSFRVRRRTIPLADVPPVLLAECHGDLAAVAALGPYDPDYDSKTGL